MLLSELSQQCDVRTISNTKAQRNNERCIHALHFQGSENSTCCTGYKEAIEIISRADLSPLILLDF